MFRLRSRCYEKKGVGISKGGKACLREGREF